MPTYAYRCKTCGQAFDLFQPITSAPLERCLESICVHPHNKGAGTVERIISGGAGLIFNGNGFYTTDYKRSESSSQSPMERSNPSCSSGSCACSSSTSE